MSEPERPRTRFDFAKVPGYNGRRSSFSGSSQRSQFHHQLDRIDTNPMSFPRHHEEEVEATMSSAAATTSDSEENVQTSADDGSLFSERHSASDQWVISEAKFPLNLNASARIFTPRKHSSVEEVVGLGQVKKDEGTKSAVMDIVLKATGMADGVEGSDHRSEANEAASPQMDGANARTNSVNDETDTHDPHSYESQNQGNDQMYRHALASNPDFHNESDDDDSPPPPPTKLHPILTNPFILDRILDHLSSNPNSQAQNPNSDPNTNDQSKSVFLPLLTVNHVFFTKAAERIYAIIDPPLRSRLSMGTATSTSMSSSAPGRQEGQDIETGSEEADNENEEGHGEGERWEGVGVEKLDGTCLYRWMMDAGASFTRTAFYASLVKDLTIRLIVHFFDPGLLHYLFHLYPGCSKFTFSLASADPDRAGVIMTFNRAPGTSIVKNLELGCYCELDGRDRENVEIILGGDVRFGGREKKVWKVSEFRVPEGYAVDVRDLMATFGIQAWTTSHLRVLDVPGLRVSFEDLEALHSICPALTHLTYTMSTPLADNHDARSYLDDLGALWPTLTHLDVRTNVSYAWHIPLDEALTILAWRCPNLRALSIPMDPSLGLGGRSNSTGMKVFFQRSPPEPKLPQFRLLKLKLCEFTDPGITALEGNGRLMALIGSWCDVVAVAPDELGESGSAETRVATTMYARELNQGRRAALSHWAKPAGEVGWGSVTWER